MYDATKPSKFTEDECAKAVGLRATLILTGVITSSDVSQNGPFVKFQPDDRFGFGDFRLGIDLDALTLAP